MNESSTECRGVWSREISPVALTADCTAVLREAIWGRVGKKGAVMGVRWVSFKQTIAGRVGRDQRNSGTTEANMHIQGFGVISTHAPH
jgi:hypothetical protein